MIIQLIVLNIFLIILQGSVMADEEMDQNIKNKEAPTINNINRDNFVEELVEGNVEETLEANDNLLDSEGNSSFQGSIVKNTFNIEDNSSNSESNPFENSKYEYGRRPSSRKTSGPRPRQYFASKRPNNQLFKNKQKVQKITDAINTGTVYEVLPNMAAKASRYSKNQRVYSKCPNMTLDQQKGTDDDYENSTSEEDDGQQNDKRMDDDVVKVKIDVVENPFFVQNKTNSEKIKSTKKYTANENPSLMLNKAEKEALKMRQSIHTTQNDDNFLTKGLLKNNNENIKKNIPNRMPFNVKNNTGQMDTYKPKIRQNNFLNDQFNDRNYNNKFKTKIDEGIKIAQKKHRIHDERGNEKKWKNDRIEHKYKNGKREIQLEEVQSIDMKVMGKERFPRCCSELNLEDIRESYNPNRMEQSIYSPKSVMTEEFLLNESSL